MTTRPRRLITRFLVACVATATLLLPSLGAGSAIAAPASTTGLPPVTTVVAQSGTATITLSKSRDTLARDDSFVLESVITNTGTTTLLAGRATMSSRSTPLATRITLDTWLSRETDLRLPDALNSVAVPALAPGESHRITPVNLTAEQLGLRTLAGNIPIRAYYRAGDTTAEKRESVLFSPTPLNTAVPTTVIVPITVPASGSGLIPADELESLTETGGSLDLQLQAVRGHNVTLGIDPMILASIRVLGHTAPESATTWLADLIAAHLPSFLLQYGDADPSVQAQSGRKKLLTPTSLDYGMLEGNFPTPVPTDTPTAPSDTDTDSGSTTDGTSGSDTGSTDGTTPTPPGTVTSPVRNEGPTHTPAPADPAEPERPAALPTLEDLLSWPDAIPGIAWPVTTTVAEKDLAVFADSGITSTLVTSQQTSTKAAFTPGAFQRAVGTHLLVSDDVLSEIFDSIISAAPSFSNASALTDLRREYAGMALEPGGAQRPHIITLERNWNTAGLDAGLDALAELGVTPVGLSSILTTPAADVSFVASAASTDRIAQVTGLLEGEQRIKRFSTVLETPELLSGRERAQVLSLLAVSWADSYELWRTAIQEHAKSSAATLSSVSLMPTEQFNMVSWQSKLGFSVRNDLPYPVIVTLNVAADNLRLSIDSEVSKVIPAFTSVKYQVPVTARIGNGQTTLTLTLTDQEGHEIAPASSVLVNVRADWEKIGATILFSFVGLLLVGGLIRTLLKRRSRRSPSLMTPENPETAVEGATESPG